MAIYHKDEILSTDDRQKLLTIARQFIDAAVRAQLPPTLVDTTEQIRKLKHGVFVSIRTGSQLRGCKGVMESVMPLYSEVSRVARAAATDVRFSHIMLDHLQLGRSIIEVEVVSNLEKITNPLDFEVGAHGIAIQTPKGIGVFLPDAIAGQGWTQEQALDECCKRKLNLDKSAWREGKAIVSKFTTIKFAEN